MSKELLRHLEFRHKDEKFRGREVFVFLRNGNGAVSLLCGREGITVWVTLEIWEMMRRLESGVLLVLRQRYLFSLLTRESSSLLIRSLSGAV
jgi:hypothetical protein